MADRVGSSPDGMIRGSRAWQPARQRPPIAVALIGAGSMGKGLAYQAEITGDVHCVAIADIDVDRAVRCAEALGRDYRVAGTTDEVERAIGESKLAISSDGAAIASARGADVLIESSSAIAAGGRYAELAISSGKHVVMMNAEADLIFGPYLMRLSHQKGVVYTTTDGDQPGVIMHLVDELEDWGFELVMAGNIKGFLDRDSNPTKIRPEADKRNLDYRMAAGYTDGSKLCVEMALVANAMGLSTTRPGMVGPRIAHVREVFAHFDFEAIRRGGPVVDYVLGAEPDGGVFAVGYCNSDYQRSMLTMLKMGPGPFYLFYRPYHLCHIEAFHTVRLAAAGRPLLQPRFGFRTNVYAYAKTDLPAGARLDGFGGYTCYGLIENCVGEEEVRRALPLCLADDVTLRRSVRKDERLTLDDVDYDAASEGFVMFEKALAASASLSPS